MLEPDKQTRCKHDEKATRVPNTVGQKVFAPKGLTRSLAAGDRVFEPPLFKTQRGIGEAG